MRSQCLNSFVYSIKIVFTQKRKKKAWVWLGCPSSGLQFKHSWAALNPLSRRTQLTCYGAEHSQSNPIKNIPKPPHPPTKNKEKDNNKGRVTSSVTLLILFIVLDSFFTNTNIIFWIDADVISELKL